MRCKHLTLAFLAVVSSLRQVELRLNVKFVNHTLELNKQLVTVNGTTFDDNRMMSLVYSFNGSFSDVLVKVVFRNLQLKMTVVSETLNICTKMSSKNLLVNFLLGAVTRNLDRELSCPLHGVYKWSGDVTKEIDSFGLKPPPFLKDVKATTMVMFDISVTANGGSGVVKLGRQIDVLKISFNKIFRFAMDAFNFAAVIPPWLDRDLFEKAFRSFENDPAAQVHSFDLQPATQPGEGMASAVFRGKIRISSKFAKGEVERSVFVKTKPAVPLDAMAALPAEMAQQLAVFHDSNMFAVEMAMYGGVLPKVEALLHSVGERDVKWPRLIYQTASPKPVIILEDVTESGFDTSIKTFHDDFEISKMVIERLAKYHAATFYLDQELKIDIAPFTDAFYRKEEVTTKLFGQFLDFAVMNMSTWEGFEEFIEPLKNFRSECAEKYAKSYSPVPGANAFNVINHGDFHVKNLLYKMKSEDEGVEDFAIYDFQIAVYGSPAIDLIYALYNFVSAENRHNRYDEILQIYHQQFVASLTKFGSLKPPPTLVDLHVEMLRNGHIQVVMAVCMLSMLMLDMSTLTPEDIAGGMQGLMVKAANAPKYKEVMRRELPMFKNKGFLA